jgi:hypothetical protein
MRCKVEEEGRKIEGQGGAGWSWATLCSAALGVAVEEGDMFVASSHSKEDGGAGIWAREEEERTI